MTLIYFIIVLGVTVFIHELGHFIFAKKAGIYVYEFSLGMGPALIKRKSKKSETVYCLRLFPIGGYVQMAGESVEEDEKIPKEKRLQSKTWMQRCLTVIAGVLFNFILAILIFFIIGLFKGTPTREVYIKEVEEQSPSMEAGLEVESQIIKINNKKIYSITDLALEFEVLNGKKIDFEVKTENGETKKITVEPTEEEKDGKKVYHYGFSYGTNRKTGFFNALKYAFTNFIDLIYQIIMVLFYLFTGKLSLRNLSGPVGIYKVVGEASKYGFFTLINLIGLLCVNVGFINILPLPAFDGGRLLFLVIEKIKGKPVDAKLENTIHFVGMILLMILMVIITGNDIIRLIK